MYLTTKSSDSVIDAICQATQWPTTLSWTTRWRSCLKLENYISERGLLIITHGAGPLSMQDTTTVQKQAEPHNTAKRHPVLSTKTVPRDNHFFSRTSVTQMSRSKRCHTYGSRQQKFQSHLSFCTPPSPASEDGFKVGIGSFHHGCLGPALRELVALSHEKPLAGHQSVRLLAERLVPLPHLLLKSSTQKSDPTK